MAASLLLVFVVLSSLSSIIISPSSQCGISTHIAIGHQAIQWFEDQRGNTSYRKIILAHQDGFIAGNPYPDAMYSSLCYEGKFHSVAEDTHWAPFLNATVNYIRRKYPKPWDEETEKLVAFTLGFVSHQVADVTWHSLGIQQGFLQTMGDVNFFGSFPAAHNVGDEGGDLINTFEGETSPIPLSVEKWYVPTQDLANIYNEYYGKEVITAGDIQVCTGIIFLGWLGEKIGGAKLFKKYAKPSPFLTEQLHDYFQGGLADMAGWTGLVWHEAIDMLEHGTDFCKIPHSPLFIHCNSTKQNSLTSVAGEAKRLKNPGPKISLPGLLEGLSMSDIEVLETDRGVHFSASSSVVEKVLSQREHRLQMKRKKTPQSVIRSPQRNLAYKSASFTVKQTYAKLGWSILTGNFSGTTLDLVASAPGYGTPGHSQHGRVYILHSGKDGSFPMNYLDLDTSADVILDGVVSNGRFGSAMAVVDLNRDGLDDLAVSATSAGADQLQYTGTVYVYYGTPGTGLSTAPSLTIQGKGQYYNLGTNLLGADLNRDGYRDLIIGSPYAPVGGPQRGSVTAFLAKTLRKPGAELSVLDADWSIAGEQDFSWFGYSMHVTSLGSQPVLIVGAPTFRICAKSDCTYSSNDTQSVGRIYVYTVGPKSPPVAMVTITGDETFMKLGAALSVGRPHTDNTGFLAVSATTQAIAGHITEIIPTTFDQSGAIYVLNMSDILIRKGNLTLKDFKISAVFEGDRSYGRFGWTVQWADLNMDGVDDLMFSAPFRTSDITEEIEGSEEGELYVFYGGKDFPTGSATRGCKEVDPCPGKKASLALATGEDHARFGWSFLSLSGAASGCGHYLAVSAPRSSTAAFHAGSVHLYCITK